MDRGEPTLVPEWLKANSGGNGGYHHQNHHQHHHSPSLASDSFDSSSSSTRRVFGSFEKQSFSNSRRGSAGHIVGADRQNSEREHAGNSHLYANFRRSTSFRTYDAVEREKDWERERVRERNLASRESLDNSQRRSHFSIRSESESVLRRSRSAISNRISDNGDRKYGNELQSLATPLASSALSSNMQKAVFDKNFPSLKGEERQSSTHSSLVNINSNGNICPIWQAQGLMGKNDALRCTTKLSSFSSSSSCPVSCVPPIAVDGWKSVLADAPIVNGSVSLSSCPVSIIQQIPPGSLISAKTLAPHTPTSSGAMNMAEALTQSTPKPKTSQVSVDSQRMEEWALKQSKLIPMTPSMPKAMGSSSSEKLKTKGGRSTETVAAVKAPSTTSHLANSPKSSQGGKLVVLKSGRDTGYTLSSKVNGATARKAENSISMASGIADGCGNGNTGSLRKKGMPDQKQMNNSLTGLDVTGIRPKESTSNLEDKKLTVQAQQNRNDFFKALRRKALENSCSAGPHDLCATTVEPNDNVIKQDLQLSSTDSNDNTNRVQDSFEKSDNSLKENGDEVTQNCNETTLNGCASKEANVELKDNIESGSEESSYSVSIKVGSEEEEAAFLRSLGWEENGADEDGLTQEEINAFLEQQHRKNGRLQNLRISIEEK